MQTHALSPNSQFLQSLINAIADPLLVKDRQHRWVLFNNAFCEFVKRQPAELLNRTDADFLTEDQAERFWQKDEQVFVTGVTTETEELFQDLAGNVFEVAVKKSLLQDEAGDLFLVCITQDIRRYNQIESELRQSQQMLQLVMDNIPQHVFWKDRDLIYQGCNANFARAAGVGSPEEIVGKSDYDLAWKQEESEWFRACDRRVLESGAAEIGIVEPQLQANGQQRWLETNKMPLRDRDGQIIGILGAFSDITEYRAATETLQQLNLELEHRVAERTTQLSELVAQLKQEVCERQQAENRQRESQQLLRLVMDNIPQLVFWKDRNSVYQGCNQSGARVVGVDSPDAIIGWTDYNMPWTTEQADWYRKCDQRVMTTGIPDLHIIEPQQQANGRQAWLDTNKIPLCDEQGNAIGILVTIEDITDRKAAEQALIESETRFRSIVENANDTIVMLTPQCEMSYTSPHWLEMFGYSSQETLHHHFARFIHPEDLAFCMGVFGQIATGAAEALVLEYRAIHRDGSCRWHTTNLSSIKDTTGQVQHCVAIIRDITERKAAEAQLQQQTRDLQTALQELKHTQMQMIQGEKMSSLGQLVAGVAHEINNPVNFIYGNLSHANSYTQDLLELVRLYQIHYPEPVAEVAAAVEAIELDFLIDDLPKLLSSMRVGAERIQTIVASLRSFSRMDEAETKAICLHEGIDSTLMILQSRLKGKGRQPQIEVVKQYGDLPLVECYAGQLNQVFMNILTNAIDALEDQAEQNAEFLPQITISTKRLANQICVKIADNGIGMSEAVQQRLFDPFFTTKPVGKGTGMGLSISYQIVTQKHGGSLCCVSTPGQGTVFSVIVPVAQAPVAQAPIVQAFARPIAAPS